ncbi:MAG TPA: FAD/NAD(P)-binding oxidoreductase [Fimbriimonadaceae bacterium]
MADKTKYLIIGGGVASVSAAKGIRDNDPDGRVLLITADPLMPYDHPPLSKDFLSNPEMTHDDVSSKYDHWYDTNKIEVKLATRVKGVDRRNHFVILENGDHVEYEKLLLATGSRANPLPKNDEQRGTNIHTLRSFADASSIREKLKTAKKVVVLGGGFLGPEVASQCRSTGHEVMLLTKAAHIWDKFASPGLGAFLNAYYRGQGVNLVENRTVTSVFEDKLFTSDNQPHPYDLLVVCVGVTLNYELAENCGISFLPDDGIKVDEYLQSPADPDIYAAGDVAYFRDFVMDKEWHLEHHLNAQWQGAVAGANMAGARIPYDKVPYFFSDFFDLHMILRGYSDNAAHTTLFGSFESAEFIELYADETGWLKMGLAISREEKLLDPISDKLEELIRKKVKVSDLSPADFA